MLAKCSNPSCKEVFRYLHDGRVFILESNPVLPPDRLKKPEYFWLCRCCSSKMTLRFGEDEHVSAMSLPAGFEDDPTTKLCSHDRRAEFMLRTLVFPECLGKKRTSFRSIA